MHQLKQLNLQQSLADLAFFIRYQKSNNPELKDSKVILVGGSYSGSMVTWMTQRYPDLIAASWASSAPLLAKADFYGKFLFCFIWLSIFVFGFQNTWIWLAAPCSSAMARIVPSEFRGALNIW